MTLPRSISLSSLKVSPQVIQTLHFWMMRKENMGAEFWDKRFLRHVTEFGK